MKIKYLFTLGLFLSCQLLFAQKITTEQTILGLGKSYEFDLDMLKDHQKQIFPDNLGYSRVYSEGLVVSDSKILGTTNMNFRTAESLFNTLISNNKSIYFYNLSLPLNHRNSLLNTLPLNREQIAEKMTEEWADFVDSSSILIEKQRSVHRTIDRVDLISKIAYSSKSNEITFIPQAYLFLSKSYDNQFGDGTILMGYQRMFICPIGSNSLDSDFFQNCNSKTFENTDYSMIYTITTPLIIDSSSLENIIYPGPFLKNKITNEQNLIDLLYWDLFDLKLDAYQLDGKKLTDNHYVFSDLQTVQGFT